MDIETMGVEEEYLVVDRETRAMVPRSDWLLGHAPESMAGEVGPELNMCQIEVGSPICTTADEVEGHLARLRRSLDLVAQPVGLGVVALGSHPFSSWETQAIDRGVERFHHIDDRYRAIAREQVICGCHVHVGIDDPDLLVRVMTRVRRWLGPLLALTANSPFWSGIDTGYASFRTQVWRRWPTAGVPPALGSRQQYDGLVDQLVDSGAIDDESYVYWHLRPSRTYPTLEFRVFDVCLTAAEAATVAALARALSERALAEVAAGVPDDEVPVPLLEAATWRAARYGLRDRLVSPISWRAAPAATVVREMLDHARPSLDRTGDTARVERVVHDILAGGNGAARQQLAHRAMHRLEDVVDLALVATAGASDGELDAAAG